MKLGYRKLDNNCIAVLAILGINNENREHVINKNNAMFICSKVKVLRIYNMFTKEDQNSCNSIRFSSKPNTYTVGEIKEVNNYSEIRGTGIHYFLSTKTAYYFLFNVPKNYSGVVPFYYYINGLKKFDIVYHKGNRIQYIPDSLIYSFQDLMERYLKNNPGTVAFLNIDGKKMKL